MSENNLRRIALGMGPIWGIIFLNLHPLPDMSSPGLNADEIQIPYDGYHKVSSMIKSHQNTHSFVKYEVIWKCQINLPNAIEVLIDRFHIITF